ncbi:MAG: SUMF1/EgtB/PvdO family nonheme iron enzyme [Deltaproteobacteria bacterium]|nr:SUMF1/EgtB/PvdO family nonheme iron enzyme [Deltaproteobacteria bacterium]
MVLLSPGVFRMGSVADMPGRRQNGAKVRLTRAFEIGVGPVTQGLWRAVMRENPSRFSSGPIASRRPVEKVSWFEAAAFCNKLSAACGLAAVYTNLVGNKANVACDHRVVGFRLPTEAEWEYAARAGQDHRFAGSDDPDGVAWYRYNAEQSTQPVGTKLPNNWGLFDMSGNVREWCADWYSSHLAGGVDPVGPASGAHRVHRGGSWNDVAEDARVAKRYRSKPHDNSSRMGLRLARTVS